MKVSIDGINLIKKYEGCRLTAYKCPAGVWTIGYGHTKNVKSGMKITQYQANELLEDDLKQIGNIIINLVNVSMHQNQFDALVSFTFNCESGALKRSTLLKKLNNKDYDGAANEFTRWNKSNGKVLNGLVKRRADEKALFLKSDIKYLSNKSYKGKSIVEALQQINVDYSYSYRKKLALANGINAYTGTNVQNLRMLNLLKNGKLIKG